MGVAAQYKIHGIFIRQKPHVPIAHRAYQCHRENITFCALYGENPFATYESNLRFERTAPKKVTGVTNTANNYAHTFLHNFWRPLKKVNCLGLLESGY